MENRYFNISDIKEKFALLISKLTQAGFLVDYINDVMVNSPFFDCFEKNDLEEFMTLSLETIAEKVFKKEVVFNNAYDPVNAYYWAGLSIMDIMANYKVPLKRILIVMPLREIVTCFNPFHEMDPIQFCEYYLKKEDSCSILKILRKEKRLSLSDISNLTEIKLTLLKILDTSNASLMATSFRNLNRLSELFSVSLDVFKKESNFLPYSSYMVQGQTFGPILMKNIIMYFGFDKDTQFVKVDFYKEDKEIRELLKENKLILDMSNPFGIYYMSQHRIIRKYLTKEEFSFLYKKSIKELSTNSVGLIF